MDISGGGSGLGGKDNEDEVVVMKTMSVRAVATSVPLLNDGEGGEVYGRCD